MPADLVLIRVGMRRRELHEAEHEGKMISETIFLSEPLLLCLRKIMMLPLHFSGIIQVISQHNTPEPYISSSENSTPVL